MRDSNPQGREPNTLSKSHRRRSLGVVAVLTCGSCLRATADGYPRTSLNETATETAVSILPRMTYSSTFTAIRTERREHHLRTALHELDPDGDDPHPIDLDTITVINDWWPVHYGHRDDGERELAAAIAERHRAQRRSRTTTRRAS